MGLVEAPFGTEGSKAVGDSPWRRWVAGRFDSYSRACLVAAAFLVPVSLQIKGLDSFSLIKVTVLWVCGVCALAFWVLHGIESGRWLPRSRMVHVAFAFLAVYALATAFSLKPSLSLLGRTGRFGGLIPLALYITVMVLVVATYSARPRRLRQLAWAHGAAATIVSVYVLVQASGYDRRVGPGTLSEFPFSTLGNSNFAGSYLAIALPLSLFTVLSVSRPRLRALAGALLGLQALALWYTQTRGAIFAAVVSAAVVFVLSRREITRRMKMAGAALFALAGVTLVIAVWHPGMDRAPGPLAALRTSTSTLENRVYYWGGAMQIFLHNPVIGTGPDTFYAHYPEYRPAADAEKNGFVLTDKPHNVFLEHATSAGVLGIGTYVLLLFLGFRYGIRRLRTVAPEDRTLLLCILGGMVAYVVQGFFSIDVPGTAVMGWVLLGAIACLADPRVVDVPAPEARPALAPSRPPRWALHGVVVVVAGGLLFVGLLPLRANKAAGEGRLAAAARLLPMEADYPARMGRLEASLARSLRDPAEKLRHLESAEALSMKARRLQPGNFNYTLDVATHNTIWAQSLDPGRFAVAEQWWFKAMAEDVNGPGMRLRYERALNEMRDRAGELEGLAHSDAGNAEAWLLAAKAHSAVKDTTRARNAVTRALEIAPDHPQAGELLARLSR